MFLLQLKYTERLVMLTGPFLYLPPPPPSPPLAHRAAYPRTHFELPPAPTVLVGLMQPFMKIHPRFDWVVRTLLHREPTAVLVLFNRTGVEVVQARLALARTRVTVVATQWVSDAEFLGMPCLRTDKIRGPGAQEEQEEEKDGKQRQEEEVAGGGDGGDVRLF
jgi:hypothetical protein